MSEHLLDVNEALKQVPVSRATLYRVINRGQLRHIRIQSRILIRQDWLDEYLESCTVGKVLSAGGTGAALASHEDTALPDETGQGQRS